MRYIIEDRKSYLKEVQERLYSLYSEGIVSRPSRSREYDANTRGAVLDLQYLMGIDPDGIIDKESFEALVDLSEMIKATAKEDEIFIGEYSCRVELLNKRMLPFLLEYDYPGVLSGKLYSDKTEDAVMYLKRVFMLKVAPGADKEFMYRLKLEERGRDFYKNNRAE